MANLILDTPKEFDATLRSRAMAGTAYVISANEYNSLPESLKKKYYPLFRRADTTYRLYPQFMGVRRDTDPNTQVVRLVPRRKVVLPKQAEQEKPRQIQREILPVNNQFITPQTDLNMKSLQQIAQETQTSLVDRIRVNTQYSRY